MSNLKPSQAAQELLKRRKARVSMADFSAYLSPDEPPAEHHRLLCAGLDRVLAGEIDNLMVFMPPGSAKSTYATVKFPAYVIGRWDAEGVTGRSVISGSYGQDLASAFGRKVRNLVKTPEYQDIYPGTELSLDSTSKSEWDTAKGNNYKSVGVGAGITGRRGDFGIIDDPVKGMKDADSEVVRESTWQWYKSDYQTRLKPGSPEIIILTRWHEDDLAGRILCEDWDGESGWVKARDGRKWYVICLPAEARENDILQRAPGEWLWPEWFSPDWWVQTKISQTLTGSRVWNSLYQQTPTAEEGDFFRREWFNRFHPGKEPMVRPYISTDFAVTDDGGDFTEFGVFGLDASEDMYAVDWWYGQTDSLTWVEALLDCVQEHKPLTTYGEKGVIKSAMDPILRKRMQERGTYTHIEWINRNRDKAAMAQAFRARAAQGKVYIPYTEWGERLINQLCAFPAGRNDDAVDVCALFGLAVDEAIGISPPSAKPKQGRDRWDKAFDDDGSVDGWRVA